MCWTLSCLLGFTPLFGWRNYSSLASDSTNTSSSSFISPPCTFLSVISLHFMVYFNFLGCVMAPLLVMTLLYTQIFWGLQGRLKESCPQAKASLLREKRLACSLALVLILFAGCWIPLHLMNCLLLFQGPQAVTQGTLYTGRWHCDSLQSAQSLLYFHVERFVLKVPPVVLNITFKDHTTHQKLQWNLTNKLIFSRYSPVSRQLSSQPCGLRVSHPKDPTGLQSNMETLYPEAELLPWGQERSAINNRQPSQSHRDLWIGRKDHTLTRDHRVILSPVCLQVDLIGLCQEVFTHSHKKISPQQSFKVLLHITNL